MGVVIAAVSAGALGLAAAITGALALLRRHDHVGRRADAVAGTDPRLATELRDLQSQIDAGRSGYRP
ncbi:hypothetical protein GCM10010988_40490 [Cnuibacter physcomitrellae]|nr:hypothetical protein GCM10010988_40490 [Cnuibacter physcomitrellae]